MATLYQRTRRPREKFDRLEIWQLHGDQAELVDRIALVEPTRLPRRVVKRLAGTLRDTLGDLFPAPREI